MSDDDHVNEDVEIDIIVANVEVVNNNNKKSHGIATRKKSKLV